MTFAWPQLLWLLLLPAALLAWELSRGRRGGTAATHPKILRAEIGKAELSIIKDQARNGRRSLRPWLAAGLVCAIAALARPQWGRIDEPVFDQSREILLAVDLSRSMLAPDIKPSRLDRAKLLIQSLLEKLEGERVGLVVFSGTAFLQSPLSSDYEILREFLPSLNPDFLPEGGTNYRALIDTSLDALGSTSSADRFLIILSDGEATDDDWKSRVDELNKRGVRVISLGIGTLAGTMIPDGSGGFVKDERGAVVLSKLEAGTLQQLAESTQGVYRDASTWLDLADLIQQTVNAGKKGEFVDKNTVRLVERFQWPLALALWCFLVSFFYEFPVRPRTRDIALRRPGKPGPTSGNAATERSPAVQPSPASGAGSAALLFLIASAAFMVASHASAAVSLAPVQPQGSVAPAPVPASPGSVDPAPLSKTVARLSTADSHTARDWSEFAHETLVWGSRLQSAQRPVPEGPVRDALTAVDLGSKLDSHATDWPQLRTQLEALLKKPEPPPQQQNKDNQQQKKDQQQQQNNNPQQNQQQQPQEQKKQQEDQQQPQQPKQNESNPSSPEHQKEQQKEQQQAFGDMNKPQPPQRASETQKVGGAQEKQEQPREPVDPALARPLEKLEQLKDKDSPAQLFEMLQGDRSQGSKKKPTKDW